MFVSGMSMILLLSIRFSMCISDCFYGMPMIVVALYHASLACGRMYTVESRSYVSFLCMSASLWYVLKNNLPSYL